MDLKALEVAKNAQAAGKNIAEALRTLRLESENTEEIIEIAYELQAGSYIQFAETNSVNLEAFAEEYAELLKRYVGKDTILLDVGSGELTTLSFVLSKLPFFPSEVIATDISWSRLKLGLDFTNRFFGNQPPNLKAISCEIGYLPFSSKSIDVTISNHALEPNGANLRSIMSELFRVTNSYLVLFEPYYEGSSKESKDRMRHHGYFNGIEEVVSDLGGEIESIIPLQTSLNNLNQTHCFIISPPGQKKSKQATFEGVEQATISVPGTDSPIFPKSGYYHEPNLGLCFPVLEGIPILRRQSSILASRLDA